jgi:DNA mismatch repair protein MutS2
MDPKTLELLEFKKVQDMLAKEAGTSLGRAKAFELSPGTPAEARASQRLGREIMSLLGRLTAPSLYAVTDVRPKALSAGQGITLSPADLKHILDALLALESLARWLEDIDGEYPALSSVKARTPKLPGLRAQLDSTVDENGEIRDSASPKLKSIRRSYREFQERLRRRAEELTRHSSVSQYLQEPIVSLRNGRYVLPVKQEHASRIQGLIHDQSASGQTVFLEPSELLEMGNQLRRLELMERDEIERILMEVSGSVGEASPLLVSGVDALADFDLGLAKARLAIKWRGDFPKLVDEHLLLLSRAWHPLLTGKPVPLDIEINEKGFRTVVITGPNMGGKTVALKTCGLLSAMALSGMPCPCGPETTIGHISDVLCDIGDEQSIEESLSTFSAHISNVIRILEHASPGKLVLIDELGAGTDPKEGAALALAILNRLNSSGALCLITSHFSELKLAAQTTAGMQNASMEWDAINMAPTYRLLAGRPGRSYAFVVAAKLGMDPDVLDEARSGMNEELVQMEDVIAELETSSQEAREQAALATRDRELAEAFRSEYERKLEELERERRGAINAAKHEAALIVSRARVEFEKTVKDFREKERQAAKVSAADITAIREKLNEAREEFVSEEQFHEKGEPLDLKDVEIGRTVAVEGLQEPGIILSALSPDGTVQVRVGSLTLRASLDDLGILEEAQTRKAKNREIAVRLSVEKAKSVSYEVDLRGMTSDEAFVVLDKYLDDAVLAGLSEVRIIHGKGTGALRRWVAGYLASHRLVQEHRLGETGEGGSGVTVARLHV